MKNRGGFNSDGVGNPSPFAGLGLGSGDDEEIIDNSPYRYRNRSM